MELITNSVQETLTISDATDPQSNKLAEVGKDNRPKQVDTEESKKAVISAEEQ